MASLKANSVRELTKPGRYSDGQRLYLNIAPGGTKSWIMRATRNGKRGAWAVSLRYPCRQPAPRPSCTVACWPRDVTPGTRRNGAAWNGPRTISQPLPKQPVRSTHKR